MVGDDEDAVVGAQVVERSALHLQVIFAAAAHFGEVGIVVADDGAFPLQQLNDGQGRRFAQVIDVSFVGYAEYQDLRSVHRFLLLVQGPRDRIDDVIGHVVIDLAGQFDEAGAKVPFLGFPGKIKRVDGNAVSTQARAWIERVKPERLGGGSFDHLPDVQTHAQAEKFQLIHQGDIHAAVDVF